MKPDVGFIFILQKLKDLEKLAMLRRKFYCMGIINSITEF